MNSPSFLAVFFVFLDVVSVMVEATLSAAFLLGMLVLVVLLASIAVS